MNWRNGQKKTCRCLLSKCKSAESVWSSGKEPLKPQQRPLHTLWKKQPHRITSDPSVGQWGRRRWPQGGLNAPGSLPHINSHRAGSQLVHRLAESRTLAQKCLPAFVSTSFRVFAAAFMEKAFQDKNLPVFLQRLQPRFLIYSLKCPLNSVVMAAGKQ